MWLKLCGFVQQSLAFMGKDKTGKNPMMDVVNSLQDLL
jgi:hypothetical protein